MGIGNTESWEEFVEKKDAEATTLVPPASETLPVEQENSTTEEKEEAKLEEVVE